ncbi:hypothetical protein [Listeria ilorinensis]|uniref:hypothetical protein n=1 Tax=Listeria ilorinensis TaxID=2867439 RepID=UPI001EF45371|nr:hypothetical protein [Listeria ilorinensis]
MNAIYLLLTHTKTPFSKAIAKVTGFPYTHVSLALDDSLFYTYSFGRKNQLNPLAAGFVQENLHQPVFQNATCLVYRLRVSKRQRAQIQELLADIRRNQKSYHYSFLGVISFLFGKKDPRKFHFFCSQFVGIVLQHIAVDLQGKEPYQLLPSDFTHLENLEEIYSGTIRDYPLWERHTIVTN